MFESVSGFDNVIHVRSCVCAVQHRVHWTSCACGSVASWCQRRRSGEQRWQRSRLGEKRPIWRCRTQHPILDASRGSQRRSVAVWPAFVTIWTGFQCRRHRCCHNCYSQLCYRLLTALILFILSGCCCRRVILFSVHLLIENCRQEASFLDLSFYCCSCRQHFVHFD